MPRIITGNRRYPAANAAMEDLRRERERQDRLNLQAQQLGLAEREFELRQQNADRNFGLDQQQFELGKQQVDFNQRQAQQQAERQGAIFERSVGQEDAARQFYASVIHNDPDRSPEEIAFLQQADPATLAQQANRSMMAGQLREGRMRLESLAGTVTEAMGLEEGDPRVEVMRQFIDQSADSPEAQQKVRDFMVDQLNGSMARQAEIQQRTAAAEQFAPFAQHLMATLPPSSAGLVGSAFALYQQGNIDDEQFLSQLQDAVKNARSGTTNRTVGEEFLTSAARSFGTQMGQGNLVEPEVRSGLDTARSIASRLDVGEKKPKAATGSDEKKPIPKIQGYDSLVRDQRKRLMKMASPQQRASAAADFVQKVFDKQGLDPAENIDLVQKMLTDLLMEDER